jgi:hypothetical protein
MQARLRGQGPEVAQGALPGGAPKRGHHHDVRIEGTLRGEGGGARRQQPRHKEDLVLGSRRGGGAGVWGVCRALGFHVLWGWGGWGGGGGGWGAWGAKQTQERRRCAECCGTTRDVTPRIAAEGRGPVCLCSRRQGPGQATRDRRTGRQGTPPRQRTCGHGWGAGQVSPWHWAPHSGPPGRSTARTADSWATTASSRQSCTMSRYTAHGPSASVRMRMRVSVRHRGVCTHRE